MWYYGILTKLFYQLWQAHATFLERIMGAHGQRSWITVLSSLPLSRMHFTVGASKEYFIMQAVATEVAHKQTLGCCRSVAIQEVMSVLGALV